MYRAVAAWSRWLHIYLSMLGSVAILFFSITGLTLNHPDWFFDETTVQETGELDTAWLNNGAPQPMDWDENDYGFAVSKLEVAEFLRQEHHLQGTVTDFLAFEDECEVTFAGPGYAAIARIARDSGAYTVAITSNDLVSIFNDLHKGRHSGSLWSLVIDVSAILSIVMSIAGFMLIFFLKRRRFSGLATAFVGAAGMWILFRIATS